MSINTSSLKNVVCKDETLWQVVICSGKLDRYKIKYLNIKTIAIKWNPVPIFHSNRNARLQNISKSAAIIFSNQSSVLLLSLPIFPNVKVIFQTAHTRAQCINKVCSLHQTNDKETLLKMIVALHQIFKNIASLCSFYFSLKFFPSEECFFLNNS